VYNAANAGLAGIDYVGNAVTSWNNKTYDPYAEKLRQQKIAYFIAQAGQGINTALNWPYPNGGR
jgi:hypothetical protein